MNAFSRNANVLVLLSAGVLCGAHNEQPKMYLCVDTVGTASPTTKLVYGYINGEQTTCMTEHELREAFGKAGFSPDTAVLSAMRDSLVRSAEPKVSTDQTRADSLADAIRAASRSGTPVDLRQADLMGLSLDGCDLSGANLESADLRSASLRGCSLTNANLHAAYMKKTDLRRADCTGADLKGAYLQGADLRGVRGLTEEMIAGIGTLHEAKLDDDIRALVSSSYPDKLKAPSKCWDGNTWAEDGSCEETDIDKNMR